MSYRRGRRRRSYSSYPRRRRPRSLYGRRSRLKRYGVARTGVRL